MTEPLESFLEFEIRKRVDDFELNVAGRFTEEITAVFGASGAGKSTLLACLVGLMTPDEGFIRIKGEVMYSSYEHVRIDTKIARAVLVLQDGGLFPHLTARQNIEYGYRLIPPERRAIDPDDLCDFLQLWHLLDRYPSTLSGGEKQRVALARGVASSPRLLLLDEPVASLDVRLRNEVVAYLRDVHEAFGIPMVYVSHSLSDVMALASDALVLANGRVESFGPVADMVARVAASTRVGLDDLDNVFIGEVTSRSTVRVGDARVWAPIGSHQVGQRVTVSISASDIMLALSKPQGISARNCLLGNVTRVSEGASVAYAFIDVGTELVVELTREAATALEIGKGKPVYAVFKSSSITLSAL